MSRLSSYAEYARLSAGVLSGEDKGRADEFRRLGMDAYRDGTLELAERSLRRATRLAPERPDLHAALGSVVYDRRKYDEAEASFGAALALDPGEEDALLGMGATLHVTGRVSEAIFYYLSYLRLQPDSVVALTNLGSAFATMGQLDEATEMFERAVGLQPDNPELYATYGHSLYEAGRIDAGVEQLRRAVDARSTDSDVYRLLGLALIARDDLAGARVLLERAVDLNPHEVTTYIDLSTLLLECGEPRKAVEYASRAAEIGDNERAPGHVRAHAYWQLGWAYYQVSAWPESARASKKAVEINPQHLAARFNLGLALLRAGDVTAAREEYKGGLAIVSDALDLKSLAMNDLKAALSEDGELTGGPEILETLETRYRELLESQRTTLKADS